MSGKPNRQRMAVTDFVHGGYVSEGTAWIKYRMRCKTCGHETGFIESAKGKEPVVYCEHHLADSNEMVLT